MATLNQISAEICDLLNKPFDTMFIERVKAIVKHARATLIRQDVERNGISTQYIQSFIVELEQVDDGGCITNGCKVLRTKNAIPTPIRTKSDVPFTFVGSIDRSMPYTFTKKEELLFTRYLKYIKDVYRYGYINKFLYVYNNTKVKYVLVESIFANPEEAISFCDSTTCYTDDMEFPCPDDMIQTIKKMALEELTIMLPKNNEIEINPNDNSSRVR